jgi:formylglycine-generating enzyme required for sulfatase activity
MKKYCPRCNLKYSDGQQRFCLSDGALLSLDLPEYRWLIGETLDGKYRIDALVGVGGFGAVYSAWHLGLDRQVAYKILQPQVAQRSPEAVGLFEGEAKTAAKLQHENIVTIHDAGRTMDDISYIAMEWLEGRPLDEELAARGRLTFERMAVILRQVAAALAFAHAHRTVHRDLKPSNVMLVRRLDGGEQVKVVDFGIAKVLSSTAASTISRSIGTPAYASPEQWKSGAQIDGRADIYALGVMLFEMLTGRLPFNAKSIEELIRLKLTVPPPSLRSLLPDAPAALDDLLRAMMDIDPNRRPQKVADVPALFEAACKPLPNVDPDLLQATTVAEATEKLRQPEVQRIVEQPGLKLVIALPSGVPLGALRSAPITTATVEADGRVTRQQAGPIQFYQEALGGGVKLEMVAVPGGRFQMGSPGSESGRGDDEIQHWVRVSDFWIGRYEVTQGQWKAVMGSLPPNMADLGNEFKGDDLPVVRVSWEEAQEFIKKLNARLNSANYRLPREAEWEFAARAGKPTPFGFGANITPEIVNYDGEYPYGNAAKGKYQGHPVAVGSLGVANAFGLFDMHGNVWEWCEDWYGPYPTTEATDPTGPSYGSYRVFRGGGWLNGAVDCRSANRYPDAPGYRGNSLGFRLLRTYR